MREQEFLASLHRLRAMHIGGYPVEALDPKEQGFWLLDGPNGFLHWIVYMPTLTGEHSWRGGLEH
jgi:hypothetical protein